MAQSKNPRFKRRYRYYEILEVSGNATQDEIRRAYLKHAKVYHPDVNPNPEAHEKFKKINEAYEVLSDLTHRASYDNSLAECPICWTYEVIQTTETQWRCRHCGCKFDPSRVSEVVEQVEAAAIPERLREAIRTFQTTQCSWCRKFYTQPFLCSYRRLQSSCVSFDRLGEEERRSLLADEKWWWRMADMLQRVQERGIMAKCREPGCFALNPNPQKTMCWQCGRDSLRCPSCREAPILRYDVGKDFWKCSNAKCSRKFAYRAKRHIVEPTMNQEICPNCGKNLYYDAELLLWKCLNPVCRRIYTYQDLRTEHVRRKAEPMPKQKVTPQAKHSYRSARKSPPWRIRASPSTRKLFMSIAKLFLCLLVIADLGVIARTGCLLFTHQTVAVTGTIIFLAEVGFLIWIISVLRSSRFRWKKPSFKLVFWSLLIVAVVCAFAGIDPMSAAKDRAINFIGQSWETITTPSESPASVPVKPVPESVKPPSTSTTPSTPTKPPVVPQEELVQYMLELINKDRADNGLKLVTLGSNTAAQKHAEEMLANDYISHWGMDGMKPYMRYTLAGGFNYEAENAFMTRTAWYGGEDPSYQRDPKEMLDQADESLMGSAGHRRNILNKWHKEVNIGIAYDNERLALAQQFEGDYITFSEFPALEGGILSLSGKTLEGFTVEQIQIWYDPLPHSLTLGQLGKTYAYGLGQPAAFIRPPPPPGSYYMESETTYTWETYPFDPYEVPPDSPPPSPPKPFSIRIAPPPCIAQATVKWIDAGRWEVSEDSFSVSADMSGIIFEFGKGAYTVVIWAKVSNESVALSNYSVFVQ